MWLNIAAKLVPGIIKTGMSIASNRRKTKELESVAEMKHAERMASGELEYKKAVITNNQQGWKDEFVLILVSAPVMLLIWSIFSDDPEIMAKVKNFSTFIIISGSSEKIDQINNITGADTRINTNSSFHPC